MTDTSVITQPGPNGKVNAVIPLLRGDGSFTLSVGLPSDEFVYATGVFPHRGRCYVGRLTLSRRSFTAAPGYSWELKSELTGGTVSRTVHAGITKEVTASIQDALRNHPEILVEARRAGLTYQHAQAVSAVEEAERALEAALDRRDGLADQLEDMSARPQDAR